MLTTNNDNTLNVLITRPTEKAQSLSKSLAALSIVSVEQPLFDYQSLADYQTSEHLLTNADIIIFVSTAAVQFSHAKFDVQNWRYQHIIAVGKTTKAALRLLGIKDILSPFQENSEGLLALPELNQNVCAKTITIVRGNGGREHLASELKTLGANVTYLESYQRVWRAFTKDISKQWFKQQINCIVVTSNAILEKLVQLTLSSEQQRNTPQLTDYWRHQCLWIVASQRISDKAKEYGLTQIILSDGASKDALTKTLQKVSTN
jgi:uroporphyrinogen-III synthase